MIIKILLLAGLSTVALLAYRSPLNSRNSALRRLAGATLLALAAFSVLFPAQLTFVAELIGVGRGADLVLYLLAVASLFVWLSLYRRIHDLEDRVRTLTREIALRSFSQGPNGGEAWGHRSSSAGDRT